MKGVPAGPNAFHIHETGRCATPAFESAGGHFAIGDQKYGFLDTKETHIRVVFRRLLKPELQGEQGQDIRFKLQDDAPAPDAIALEVNARYPVGLPFSDDAGAAAAGAAAAAAEARVPNHRNGLDPARSAG